MNSPTKIIPSGVPFVPEGRNAETLAPITEAQCAAFFKARAKQLQKASGSNLAHVELQAGAYGNSAGESEVLTWRVYVDGAGSVTSALSLDDACEQIEARAKPENIAAALRAEAANLMSKAAYITRSK
jgi:hypothetical protein